MSESDEERAARERRAEELRKAFGNESDEAPRSPREFVERRMDELDEDGDKE